MGGPLAVLVDGGGHWLSWSLMGARTYIQLQLGVKGVTSDPPPMCLP